jgi:hypothetical protein
VRRSLSERNVSMMRKFKPACKLVVFVLRRGGNLSLTDDVRGFHKVILVQSGPVWSSLV